MTTGRSALMEQLVIGEKHCAKWVFLFTDKECSPMQLQNDSRTMTNS